MGRPKLSENYYLYNDPLYQNASTHLKHLKHIRYMLFRGRNEFIKKTRPKKGFSAADLIEKLAKHDIHMSRSTVESLYDPQSEREKIDITAVLYLCEWWGLDVNTVLALPDQGTSESGLNIKPTDPNRKVFHDIDYDYTYYCYFFKISGTDSSYGTSYPDTLPKREDVLKGKLIFTLENSGTPRAYFEYTQKVVSMDKKPEFVSKYASCIPYESVRSHNVFLEFIDNSGRWFEIIFDHQSFSNSPCYFRVAAMITEASQKEKLPVFQKMVMFLKEPDESYMPFIRGFLNNNPNNLIISKEALERLSGISADSSDIDPENDVLTEEDMAEKGIDPEIRKFYRCYRKILGNHMKQLYVINENVVTKEPSQISEFEAKKALIKLRHYTYSQNQMYVGLDPDAHRIARHIQENSSGTYGEAQENRPVEKQ